MDEVDKDWRVAEHHHQRNAEAGVREQVRNRSDSVTTALVEVGKLMRGHKGSVYL